MKNKPDWEQAASLLKNNRLEEAGELAQRLCRQFPSEYKAWRYLGDVLLRENRRVDAANALQRAVNLKTDTETLFLLAQTLRSSGNYQAAQSTLQRLLGIEPSHADAWFMLGIIQSQYNHHEQAAYCYQHAARLQPDNSDAHGSLANTLFVLGRMPESIACYQKTLQLNPDNINAYCNLGMALSSISRHDEAIACFKRALELNSKDPKIHLVMANTLLSMGEFEQSLDAYRAASRLSPNSVDALAGEAGVLEKLGRYKEAHEKINSLISSSPLNVTVVTAFSLISKHFSEERKACELIEALLGNNFNTATQKLSLHFAAGKLLDRLGDYDRAFSHFEQGNRNVPHQPYHAEKERESFDAIISLFSSEYMEHAPRSRNRSEKPVFIVGMPRSGTSLVENILSSHPQVFGAGELGQIQTIANNAGLTSIYNAPPPHIMPRLSQQEIDRITADHLEFLDQLSPKATRVVDKMPHNFLHLGLISILFPDARIIHCTRNPLDTCTSIYFEHFGTGNEYSYELESLGDHYCNYWRLMRHWKSLGIPMLDVSYENLVSNQEKVSRQIVDYCGLEWDERCLQFHKSTRITRTASYDQVRQPIYTRSVGRWKNYETHLEPLAETLRNCRII